jgi:hypothetical protein
MTLPQTGVMQTPFPTEFALDGHRGTQRLNRSSHSDSLMTLITCYPSASSIDPRPCALSNQELSSKYTSLTLSLTWLQTHNLHPLAPSHIFPTSCTCVPRVPVLPLPLLPHWPPTLPQSYPNTLDQLRSCLQLFGCPSGPLLPSQQCWRHLWGWGGLPH